MPPRAEGVVYHPQRIEVGGLLAWLEERNASRSEAEPVTLSQDFLTAIARTLSLRPEVNRFVSGRRTYRHNEISVSFI